MAPEWAAASAATRQAAAERLTAEIDQRRPEISRLLAEEVGIPVTPLGGYTGYKGVRRTADRRVAPGVRGVTVAWNDPRAGTPELIVPSLLAGQACVIVVAPEIALSGSVLAEAVRAADLPAGLVTVHAGGVLAVEALHGCGDVAGGRQELAQPAVALSPEADLEPFLSAMPGSCLAGNGQYPEDQTCILVPQARLKEVTDAVTETVAALRVGDPRNPDVHIGPVVDDWHIEVIDCVLALAWRDGARITLGGCRHPQWEDGCFLEPAVVVCADPANPIMHLPVPGPVLTVMPYDGGLPGAHWLARRAGLRIDATWAAHGSSGHPIGDESAEDPMLATLPGANSTLISAISAY